MDVERDQGLHVLRSDGEYIDVIVPLGVAQVQALTRLAATDGPGSVSAAVRAFVDDGLRAAGPPGD